MSQPDLVNIASHLPALAATQPYSRAIVFPEGRDRRGRVSYTHLTFRQFDDESSVLAAGLEAVGIRRGVRTVLMVPPSLDFFSLTFALFKVGAVPVLIDPGMGMRTLGQCLAEAEPAAFIGVPNAHFARTLLGWGRATITTTVTVGGRLGAGHTLEEVRQVGSRLPRFELAATTAEETAAILFTSGSTGVAKGVVYSHGIFAAQVASLRRTYGIEPGEIDLPTFPLFALFAPALGMTAIIPDMDPTRPARVDPRKLIEAVENFGVTNLFGSPAVINRLGRFGVEHGVKLPTLQRVISAGAPVPAAAIERFTKLLAPGVQVFTPYGATEALPVASIGSTEILGETRFRTDQGGGVCVGRPLPDIEAAIIPISDEPISKWSECRLLPPGEIGEIVVRGPVVTRTYFNRPAATALAKIDDPPGVRHRMGDLGYLDDAGRLWFCGRKSQRVVTAAGTFFTIPCEAVFNTHPAVFRTALVGVGFGETRRAVVCVELEPNAKPLSHGRIRTELRTLGAAHEHTSLIDTFLFHRGFPVDIRHNAKIFREKLAQWAARKLGVPRGPGP